jgi:fumarate reductase flavoprotein subunit
MSDYDVIVIGAGGAGLAAASAASANGASVLIVEAGKTTGGSTALSGGVFYAAGTSLQREAGIEGDTPDAVFQYYMTLNQYKLEAALVRKLCDDSPAAFEWLRSIGVEFRVEDLYMSGVDKVRRGHRTAGGGAAIAEGLEGSFAGRSVDIALDTRVEKLLVEPDGVKGIMVDGQPITAGATIIATGGFGANPAMLADLYPDAARHGDLHWYIGANTCQGDGIAMARTAGAQLSTANRGLLLLTPGFAKDLESYLPGWLVMVNGLGRRFVDETIEYSVLAAILNEQKDHTAFGIFDETARLLSRTTSYRPAPNWTADRLEDFISAGTLAKADSITELANHLGIPAETLQTSVARNNANVDAGMDRDFFKASDFLRKIDTPPFYAARIRAAIICWTGTGLRIDTQARVLDAADRPIPGLYAAGETTGGMFGECYASGGASIGNAVVFGLTAGRHATGANS